MPSFGLRDDDNQVQIHGHGTYAMPHSLYGYKATVPRSRKPSMPEEELITYGPPGRPLTRRPINSDILVQAGLAEDTDLGDYWRFIQEFSENALKRQKSILLDKCKTISSCLPSLTRDCFGGTLEDSATLVSFFETQCARITARISQLREARSRHEAKRSQLLEEVKAPSPVPLHQIALAPPAESVSESVSNDAKKSLALERFEDVSSKVKPVLDAYEEMARSRDPRMESVKLKFRMAINKRILQIANSRHQISNVTFGLVGILNEGWSQHGSNLVSYIVVVIAQKILDQAEAQVSLHMPSAFPIAQVVVDVSVHQRAVLFVLLYLMMKRCPYAVPRYVDKELFSSEAEFKVASGYLLLEGGIEGDQPYIERMGGILNLLGAIIQTSPSTGGYSSSYDLSQGWLWMASVLNVRPQPITPFMICAFLECAGYAMWRKYGQNFQKLLKFILEKYLPLIPKGSVAAATRLEIYVRDFFQHNPPALQPPEGSQILP